LLLDLKYIPLPEIVPWDENPKRHDIERIKASMRRYGFTSPLIVNESSGILLAGHGRRDALLEMHQAGEPAPQNIETRNGIWFCPCIITGVSLDDLEHQAYALDDNLSVMLGIALSDQLEAFRQEEAATLLGELFEVDSLPTFVDEDELYEALSRILDLDGLEDESFDVGAALEADVEPRIRRGEIWQLGDHRLMCGDSTCEEDVVRLMDGEQAIMMATDPPYGDAWVQKARDMAAKGYGHSHAELHGYIQGDDWSDEELAAFLRSWLSIAVSEVAAGPFPVYVWHGAKRILFEMALLDVGFHVHQPVIWVKPSFVIGRLHYHPRCEWALHGWLQGRGKCSFYGERNQSDIWEIGRENMGLHPVQKPIELFAIPMRNHTLRGEICYEPFLGSGTQIIAGEQLGRRVYAMEIEPKYCEVAIQRWEEFMGREAVRLP